MSVVSVILVTVAVIIVPVAVLCRWAVYPARGSEWQCKLRAQGCMCGWHWDRFGRLYSREDCPLHGRQARYVAWKHNRVDPIDFRSHHVQEVIHLAKAARSAK